MLYEDSGVFARDDVGVGCIQSLQMAIDDIQDLLAKGWIVKSKSPYAAHVVYVRKKDASLRLCIDYRFLNQMTLPDRYPLPHIQDLFDTREGPQLVPHPRPRQGLSPGLHG